MTIIFVGLIKKRNHDLDQLNKMDEALGTILPGVSISQGIHTIEVQSCQIIIRPSRLTTAFLRERGMCGVHPQNGIPGFSLNFPNELSQGYLRFEENGKIPLGDRGKGLPYWLSQFSIAKFIWRMQKSLVLSKVGWTPCLFSSQMTY